MSRRKRKKAAPSRRAQKGQQVPAFQAAQPAAGESEPEAVPSQYIFTFELIRHYPTTRSFIVKQPLKRSFKDTVSELFGGNKKGVYRF
jgi:hypothetical protein